MSRVIGAALYGVEGVPIEVEVRLSSQLPRVDIVGLPEAAVRESVARVRAAIGSAGRPFPDRRVTVNLAPASLRKSGAGLDLPIAVAIVATAVGIPPERLAGIGFVGELALDGRIRPVPGLLALVLGIREAGCRVVVVPAAGGPEASLAQGIETLVAAGLEVLVRPFPEYRTPQTNSLETTRGAAAALLERGADRIYLFNFMDSETAIDDLHNYKTLLSEVGSLDTLAGKTRRHVITYADTWAPGEPRPKALPQECAPGRWMEFRLPLGPKPASGSAAARLGIRGPAEGEVSSWEVRVNGEPCSFAGAVSLASPRPEAPVFAFQIPLQALKAGYNVIEVAAKHTGRIEWVEVAFQS